MAVLAGIVILLFGVDLKKSPLTAVFFSTIRFVVFLGLGMLVAG